MLDDDVEIKARRLIRRGDDDEEKESRDSERRKYRKIKNWAKSGNGNFFIKKKPYSSI